MLFFASFHRQETLDLEKLSTSATPTYFVREKTKI